MLSGSNGLGGMAGGAETVPLSSPAYQEFAATWQQLCGMCRNHLRCKCFRVITDA